MRDVRFSFFDVKIVNKNDSTIHTIYRFFAKNAKEAKRKALDIPKYPNDWIIGGCWRVPNG